MRFFFVFGHLFGAQNEASSQDLRAYVLAEVGAVIREGVRESKKKRDSDTETAQNGQKRCANYGLSLPLSIPTPSESLAQIRVAQWRI